MDVFLLSFLFFYFYRRSFGFRIAQRENEENLQREAEQRLEAEQAERAAEDARLRELYPLPEDEQDFSEEIYEDETLSEGNEVEENKDDLLLPKEERKR